MSRQYALRPGDLKQCPHCKRFFVLDIASFKRRKGGGFKSYCRPCNAQYNKVYNHRSARSVSGAIWRAKIAALAVYGGQCVCCGETEPVFLTFDHIGGGGNEHREKEPLARKNIGLWLYRNNYPSGFRILCFNCHKALDAGPYHLEGHCPHEFRNEP